MKIEEITHRDTWQNFFNTYNSPSFHHSWEWGEFQKKQGYEILRLGLYDKKKSLVMIALIIKITARRGRLLMIPHGPVACTKDLKIITDYYKLLLSYLQQIAKKERFWFIRFATTLSDVPEHYVIMNTLGFRKAPIYMHAEKMWAVDVTQSEEQLFAQMRKTTRYLIKKAQKESLIIEERSDDNAVDDFMQLYKETGKRENFVIFSENYIKNEFQTFYKAGNASFLFGRTKDSKKYLAAALIIFTKSSAFYHQGASIHSRLPITYLLQWTALLGAKFRGCHLYNFHGIYQKGRTPKAWKGLTLFKTGFGGFQIDYLPTHDYIISPLYWLSFLYETFLNIKRGV